jgi:hypothetical protein
MSEAQGLTCSDKLNKRIGFRPSSNVACHDPLHDRDAPMLPDKEEIRK